MLYPKVTTTRVLQDLSGVWKFKIDEDGRNEYDPKSPMEDYITIAVPGSYNDQTADNEIRNHSGYSYYEREFMIPEDYMSKRIVLRFGSCSHVADVYINGEFIVHHKGGFTPFEAEIQDKVKAGNNRLTVVLSNILDYSSLPVGVYKKEEKDGKIIHKVDENFDFFNYSGIHRPVKIYTTDFSYVDDINITYDCDLDKKTAKIKLDPKVVSDEDYKLKFNLTDEDGKTVYEGEDKEFNIEDVKLWQPLNAYLYNLKIDLYVKDQLKDSYTEEFGIRTIEVKDNKFLINGEPFYFKGFGKHEDSNLHGRGFDEVLNVSDVHLIKWLNANSFRTSHYPYSEEMMRLCDREGIVIIDEFTAVGLMHNFGFDLKVDNEVSTWDLMETKEAHEQVIKETIQRDKNHACVVMWSIANEPASGDKGAHDYFEPLFDLARELDPQKRPLTFVNILLAPPERDEVSDLCDVICLNRYYGWYVDLADLEEAEKNQKDEIERWHKKFPDKPIIFTEFGADTVSGFHSVYDIPFTEDYQVEYYKMCADCFDSYDYVIGEQLWNFADFQTKFGINRVDGNKKGIFTRDRKPKAAARYLKERWSKL